MNTADRSISLFDTALRRRFAFIELLPDYDLLVQQFGLGDEFDQDTLYKKYKDSGEADPQILSILALYRINDEILKDIQLGREKQIGHSYLLRLEKDPSKFSQIWKYEIIPLLEEFYYAESEKLESILSPEIFDKHTGIQDFEEQKLFDALNELIKPRND